MKRTPPPLDRTPPVDAVLNAILGDQLQRQRSALSIEMGLLLDGRDLPVSAAALRATPGLGPRPVILVHGLAQTEACWGFASDPTQSYGSLLASELGVTPLFLRYNTGRHISHNGRELAMLLARLFEAYPVPIQELTWIGHSLGGLLVRSAFYHAELLGLAWLKQTRRAFYLGSPHSGAPLEKAGHLLSSVLRTIDNPVVQLAHDVVNLRSAGVKDLRHGRLLDEDAGSQGNHGNHGSHGSQSSAGRPTELPLTPGIDHFFMAGTLTKRKGDLVNHLLGDTLVSVGSATRPGRRAGLDPQHVVVFPGVRHLKLASSPEVYAAIRAQMDAPRSGEAGAAATECVDHGEAGAAATECVDRGEMNSAEARRSRQRDLERLDGYLTLLQQAIDQGATAVQRVQEQFIRRPYDVLSQVDPLRAPTVLVQAVHLGAVRNTYAAIRTINAVAGAVLQQGLAYLKPR